MSGFEKIDITDIEPSNYNPRKISDTEYNKLSRSINEFGDAFCKDALIHQPVRLLWLYELTKQ